jgi:putative acyl-CoA dehydrogenase
MDLRNDRATHAVLNQPPPLAGYNPFDHDAALRAGLAREGAAWAEDRVRALAAVAASEALAWGAQANTHPPVLKTHDRYGNRIDEVEFHPAWHRLLELAIANGLHSLPWREPRPGAHVARAALFYVLAQAEAGHGCPISMTYACIPALRRQPDVAATWEPRFTSLEYDARMLPAEQKRGAICGMGMTEKQGGSDVRANTTRARPLGRGGPGGEYEIAGHKWFCSAPMSDAFLILAHTDRGLSCFLLPRWRPDGTRNRFQIQRLKDKLGNRSNASSEVEFDGTWALMVGEDGRGVPTIIEMVSHTRLDCVIGGAAGMRQAVAQATHHAAYRSAFGKLLVDQPLMQNVLADLCLESEAATTVMLHLARGYDESGQDEAQRLFIRLATAVAKYWVCKRVPPHAAEALECLGGNGYVEDSGMPRLYREAPLNSIWEGSGNVICLDVLRAIGREPESIDVFFEKMRPAAASEPRLKAKVESVAAQLRRTEDIETRARRVVEDMALSLQASLLIEHAPPLIADAFCAGRLAEAGGHAFGTLPAGIDFAAIIDRARPRLS